MISGSRVNKKCIFGTHFEQAPLDKSQRPIPSVRSTVNRSATGSERHGNQNGQDAKAGCLIGRDIKSVPLLLKATNAGTWICKKDSNGAPALSAGRCGAPNNFLARGGPKDFLHILSRKRSTKFDDGFPRLPASRFRPSCLASDKCTPLFSPLPTSSCLFCCLEFRQNAKDPSPRWKYGTYILLPVFLALGVVQLFGLLHQLLCARALALDLLHLLPLFCEQVAGRSLLLPAKPAK